MSDNMVPNDLRSAWQADDGGHIAVSADELRSRIAGVSRRTTRRTALGLIVCLLVVASWAYVWWLAPVASGVARAGILLTCLGAGVLAFQLIVNRDIDEEEWHAKSERGAVPSLAFHRWQLERQRDFHRGWRLWTPLLLFTSGGVLFCVGFAGEHPEVARTMYLELIGMLALAAAALPINARLARRYQHQLEELDSLGKDQS